MVSQATTIRDSLIANWSLTGRLSKTPTANMKEIVRFFDRWEVEGNEWPKAVSVQKINAEEDENVVTHPNFQEVSDVYQIKCRYRVVDVQELSFSEALEDVEDMAREVQRILRLTFDPSTFTGNFFVARHAWSKFDHKDQAQPELIRELRFELTQIKSSEPKVFRGFGGILVFDKSASQGDNLPISDFTYAELRNVRANEGYTQIEYLSKDQVNGRGVPFLRRGMFRGQFSALLNAHKDDIIDAGTLNLISEMGQVQTSSPLINQNANVTFLHAVENEEDPPATLTTASFLKIEDIWKIAEDEQLVTYRIQGRMRKPSTYAVSP